MSHAFVDLQNLTTPGLGAPLTNFNDGGGGPTEVHFIPKKITTSVFVYPKKLLPFLAYPKKSLSSFFATQKNPSVFFRDPITQTPLSLKYVNGAPGTPGQ